MSTIYTIFFFFFFCKSLIPKKVLFFIFKPLPMALLLGTYALLIHSVTHIHTEEAAQHNHSSYTSCHCALLHWSSCGQSTLPKGGKVLLIHFPPPKLCLSWDLNHRPTTVTNQPL